eukprot:TRINITY_DN77332_c0_g1_i1.p1 TRINITY_DN77332_c0_g1~~TRINITY_DN77332_c0_g1_i1.p1  ORF type:complete len:257 (+),score=35.60 TRINITY_DN77332_c0_g1_i1:67-771(+)
MVVEDEPTFECDIIFTSGRIETIQAEKSWKVWQLRVKIDEELDIPEHEQQLLVDCLILKSDHFLGDLLQPYDSERLKLSFVRLATPERVDEQTASQVWNAFLSFSSDGGDTMDGTYISRVMAITGMRKSSQEFDACGAFHQPLTFRELLQVVADWKEHFEPPPVTMFEMEKELRFIDVHDTGFMLMSDFLSVGRRLFVDEDDDDFDEEIGTDVRIDWMQELQKLWSRRHDDLRG